MLPAGEVRRPLGPAAVAAQLAPTAPPAAVAAAASCCEPPKPLLDHQHQRTLEVLQDVLRCLYDKDAWEKEEAALRRLGGSAEGTERYADHLDAVLTDRAAMFLKLRDGIRLMRQKAASSEAPGQEQGRAE